MMTEDAGQHTTLDDLSPAALHVLECADGRLRHSTGMRALGALSTLAKLAPRRMDKPGFREKLDASRDGAALARQECQAFFQTLLVQGLSVGDVFPTQSDAVTGRLAVLGELPLEELPAAIDSVSDTFQEITGAIQAARRGVREFVEQETPRLASLCEAERARLVTCLGAGEDRRVFLDPDRLGAAFTELVSNALKHAFGAAGDTVRVEVANGTSTNEVVAAVIDDESGIAAEMQPRLFERGASTGGSGEGLALVREIVETDHLGRLTYMTGPTGTRWEIILPVKAPPEKLGKREPLREGEAPLATARGPRAAMPRAVLVAIALAALMVLAWIGWMALRGGRAEPPSPWDAEPGRAPVGFVAVAGSGRHIATGWAREIVHEASGITLAFVPAGEFVMGSDGHDATEAPAHRVALTRPFYIGKTEVTQAQYKKVMGENPSRFKGDGLPAEQVSLLDCVVFCEKAGVRLPTEAEWELAAQGSCPPEGETQKTRTVGASPPSPLGLHDMLGNVEEWCSDWYGLYEPGDATDPAGPKRGERRVIRGGSFLSDPTTLRPSQRESLSPLDRRDFLGFRVALDAEPSSSGGK